MAHFDHENCLRSQGYQNICGIDEAGRGPLAGPVCAAACCFSEPIDLAAEFPGLTDSKKLSPKLREALYKALLDHPAAYIKVSLVDAETIDTINILQATMQTMSLACEELMKQLPIHYALIDGNRCPTLPIPSLPIIKGDAISASIAAASVAAKVTRDSLMLEYDQQWPEYGFAKHMGYGTRAHKEALEKYGPSPIHRRSFSFTKTA